MKRFFALLLASFMVCSMFTFSSLAVPENYVISPEYTEIPEEEPPLAPPTEEIPEEETPVTPPTEEIPEEETPLSPIPQSPQTGDAFGFAGFAVVAALCGAVAVISTKKAAECS